MSEISELPIQSLIEKVNKLIVRFRIKSKSEPKLWSSRAGKNIYSILYKIYSEKKFSVWKFFFEIIQISISWGTLSNSKFHEIKQWFFKIKLILFFFTWMLLTVKNFKYISIKNLVDALKNSLDKVLDLKDLLIINYNKLHFNCPLNK
jgi:hypothetical protein